MLQFENDNDDDDDSDSDSRSAQDSRSAFTQTSSTWALACKKPKRNKHKSTNAAHRGDATSTIKNNLTGVERLFLSDKCIMNSHNSFSSLDDNEDDSH